MLTQQRQRIDAIDQQLVKLLEERLHIVEEVARIKKANDLPILDRNREQQVLDKIKTYTHHTTYQPMIQDVYQHLMNITKDYQQQLNEETPSIDA